MQIISQKAQAFPLKIKKSKFIASLSPISSVNDAKTFIQQIIESHHKAHHNCFAYRLWTPNGIIHHADDNGEPTGTAGNPILFVLEKQNLINTVVVVTRYFGGVKLGKGGLIRAYSTTTSEALKAIGTIDFKD